MLLDGYVRVSETRGRHGERFISPLVQREQIAAWAQAHGVELVTIYEELDESGARADRPMLVEALDRIERGLTQGLVVAKLDRFGRSLADSLAAIERIQTAGGTFVSVQDGLDLSTDTGKLVLRIMLSMAEWELDRIRSQWRVAREHATLRGVHIAGRPPTGYTRDVDGRLHPDPDIAPKIADVFGRRAAGETLASIARELAAAGVQTSWGNTNWPMCSVRYLLRNRVYLGEIRNGEFINAKAHKPLVDAATWQAAQSPRMIGRHTATRQGTALGGLVRCAGCGLALHSGIEHGATGKRRRFYGCAGQSAAGPCPSRAWITSRSIDPYVEAAFFTHLRRRRPSALIARLEADVQRAQTAVSSYRDAPGILAALGPERFAAGLARRVATEERLLLALHAAQERESGDWMDPNELEGAWPEMSRDERRRLMAQHIECVFVLRGRRGARDRVFVCERGHGLPKVPPRGKAARGIRPFDPRDYRLLPAPPLIDPVRWSETRIREELEAYLACWGSERWPEDDDFIADGRGPLYRQIDATGGPTRWCHLLELPAPRLALDYWSDDRIRAMLPRVLAGRATMPSASEMFAIGHQGLHRALMRRGRAAWAAEFDVTLRRSGSNRRWTEENARAELTRLCAGRTTYPSRSEFFAEDLAGLFHAIAVYHGGHDQWAAEFGLPRRLPGPQRR